MSELESRFGKAARGRAVSVRPEPKHFLLARDYQVRFDADTNSFEVVLRPDGCFEGAYRCIERYIEAAAEVLDGVQSSPPGHLDFRGEMQYWMVENLYEQFRLDLEAAVAERTAWLERARPGEGEQGKIKVEARCCSLTGFLAGLHSIDREVRRAVLSPRTVDLLESISGAPLISRDV